MLGDSIRNPSSIKETLKRYTGPWQPLMAESLVCFMPKISQGKIKINSVNFDNLSVSYNNRWISPPVDAAD